MGGTGGCALGLVINPTILGVVLALPSLNCLYDSFPEPGVELAAMSAHGMVQHGRFIRIGLRHVRASLRGRRLYSVVKLT